MLDIDELRLAGLAVGHPFGIQSQITVKRAIF
ncbi:hypothetical protein RO3G_05577 [Rhizopus delemar RA 99-880]|uniref:Uncharacterized protein n=1 Tax=Rhizopus delemar (strain RA 99-880 / ATCC MYA-4621 / FGSC 9543 / NRRL 43880) TaxID=246409 RepID=I1BXE2_RHIO9|nr:hypothetical protein RO3G_05577 [Rhizopus delemar RA 99-880]|eukprot:EIE80872.1 hypothetical protein RO3G_05577 [Rhizopus delemar RA 99-880]